jgi:hypothetical protein
MFYVDIHPWAEDKPNQEVVISTFRFHSEDDAVEFIEGYNVQSQVKVALLRENELEFI